MCLRRGRVRVLRTRHWGWPEISEITYSNLLTTYVCICISMYTITVYECIYLYLYPYPYIYIHIYMIYIYISIIWCVYIYMIYIYKYNMMCIYICVLWAAGLVESQVFCLVGFTFFSSTTKMAKSKRSQSRLRGWEYSSIKLYRKLQNEMPKNWKPGNDGVQASIYTIYASMPSILTYYILLFYDIINTYKHHRCTTYIYLSVLTYVYIPSMAMISVSCLPISTTVSSTRGQATELSWTVPTIPPGTWISVRHRWVSEWEMMIWFNNG